MRLRDFDVAMRIVGAVCNRFGISLRQIDERTRRVRVVWPRQVAMALVRKHTSCTLAEVGELFGRDHATVINAVTVVSDYFSVSAEMREEVAAIEAAAGIAGERRQAVMSGQQSV
jgi:chromosomal replication initiator protein